jgi:AraC-like DNA-binding protein
MWSDIIIFTPMYVTFFWAVVLLLTFRQNNRAKHFLGIFMVTAFLLYLAHAVFFKQHFEFYFVFDSIYIFASLAVYPLYFWYIKLLTVESKLNLKNLWLLIPSFVMGCCSLLIYFLMTPAERMNYIQHFLLRLNTTETNTFLTRFQNGVFFTSRIIFALQVVIILIYGSILVKRYNQRIANFYSNLESKTIVWVNLLLFSFVVTSIMSIAFNAIGKAFFYNHILLLLIPSFIFSVLLFIIGLQGYMQNHTVADLEYDEQLMEVSEIKKYQNSTLKDNLLDLFVREEIYKQPDLKITVVSSLLQTNRTYISNLINSEFSCTFSDFVNQYRLAEAKKLLTEKTSKMYSLDFVSEKSGFGSLSTFIRVFRDSEGITPGKYRDKTMLKKHD